MQPNIKYLDDRALRGIEDPTPANLGARYAMVSDEEGDYVELEEGVFVHWLNPKDRLRVVRNDDGSRRMAHGKGHGPATIVQGPGVKTS